MEKERLLLCINRYDHYYDSVNNKSNVLLTLSIFVVGGLVAGYPTLMEKVVCNSYTHFLVGALIALGVANLLILTWTSLPFVSKNKTSLFYFGSIACMPANDFTIKSAARTSDQELADLRLQVHSLATGLQSKFKRLRIAGMLLIVQVIFFIPLVIYIINHIK
jgi:hypothetical protein